MIEKGRENEEKEETYSNLLANQPIVSSIYISFNHSRPILGTNSASQAQVNESRLRRKRETNRLENNNNIKLQPTGQSQSLQWDLSNVQYLIANQRVSNLANQFGNNNFIQQNLGPRFLIEPPSFIEYSNSTGAVIQCKPQTVNSLNGPELNIQQHQQQQQQPLPNQAQTQGQTQAQRSIGQNDIRSKLIGATPTLVTWKQVDRLEQYTQFDINTNIDENSLNEDSLESISNNEQSSMSDLSPNKLRFVRQDGSLVLSPFEAQEYRKDIHSATYRCCLTNRFGSICSKPIRARAGKSDTNKPIKRQTLSLSLSLCL